MNSSRGNSVEDTFCNDPMDLGKQCNPRSGGSFRSMLIKVCTVCQSIFVFWTHYFMEKPNYSNFSIITAFFLGVRIVFRFYHITCHRFYFYQTENQTDASSADHRFQPLSCPSLPNVTPSLKSSRWPQSSVTLTCTGNCQRRNLKYLSQRNSFAWNVSCRDTN